MKQTETLFHGVLGFETIDGYTVARRFTAEQMEAVAYSELFAPRTHCTASVTMELSTEATEISFAYKFFVSTGTRSTFEVYTNGVLTHLIGDETLSDEGRITLSFSAGEKRIEIYLPNYKEVGIRDFTANGAYSAIPKRKTKVLFIGDSITQGGGSKRSAQTYVNVAKRALHYEIINQGIGGYVFEKNIVSALPFLPDKIVVALGINNHQYDATENRRRISEFFEALCALYPSIKILALLPIYCGNPDIENVEEKVQTIKALIREIAAGYANVQVIETDDMIPHLPDYYMEDMVHPNALGMELYGQNLAKTIKKIKF